MFRSPSLDVICRSNSRSQLRDKTTLSPTLMPSAESTYPLPAGVENVFEPIPGGTGGIASLGSAAGLLLVDDWHCRSRPGRVVRKRLVEVQYLRTTITNEQREEFGHLVESTIRRIESADFLPHSGIRFPQNPCSTCPYVGLCLGKQKMIDATFGATSRSRKSWLA